jgi:hypothetical protein
MLAAPAALMVFRHCKHFGSLLASDGCVFVGLPRRRWLLNGPNADNSPQ